MKLVEILYAAGFRRAPREYSYDIEQITLSKYGTIQYAYWRHPKARRVCLVDAQVDALRKFLFEGDVAIDIGAHAGDTTIPMALAVGPEGLVFALEPNPYAYKILLANVALNVERTQIIPLMFAAADEDGMMEFEYSDRGFCNGGRHDGVSARKHAHFFKLPVRTVNLDRYLAEHHPRIRGRIRYIKIDTEGFDLAVAQSLRNLIRENHPFIRAEIHRHTDSEYRSKFFRYLAEFGYRVHKFESDVDYCGRPLTEQAMSDERQFDIFAIPSDRQSDS